MVAARRLGATALAGTVVALAAVGGVLGTSSAGRAQDGVRTIRAVEGQRHAAIAFDDLAPGGLERSGRTTLGDRLVFTAPLRRDDGVRGRLVATLTATGRGNLRTERGSAVGVGTLHFPDGDLMVAGWTSFRERDVDHLAVTGGTGAFAGARGTVDSGPAVDVIRLLP